MNPLRNATALAAMAGLLFAGACATDSRRVDFARNEMLFVDVPFQTKAPGDRAVFITPLVDARKPLSLPKQDRGFPILYGDDQVWERPVPEMLSEVLQRQLQKSGLFAQVSATASADALVLAPSLVTFVTGAAESVSGSRSFAEIGLRLQVFGPADASGKRSVLFEDSYGNRQMSELMLNPVSPYRLVGRALQVSLSKALAGLDGSNVGRSNVPLIAGPEAPSVAPVVGPPAAPVAAPAPNGK